jgi:phosphate:Na+ symporter
MLLNTWNLSAKKKTFLFFGLFFSFCLCLPFQAIAGSENIQIEWFKLIMGLLGGLALFLAGLDMLSEGLKMSAGDTLKTLLSKMTTNRFLGAFTGAFVTAVLNSSSVTTVLVVSFITANVMTLAQSVGVIMGANIGSTMTAQLLAFNISAYALLPIAIGFFMSFTAKREKVKYSGMMLMGLGLVFFGMGIMSDAMSPLRSYEPFLVFLKNMERPLLGIMAGALFTGLVQSSAATVGIAIAMATEGLLTLPAGIALALGANIGTCVTAMLASMGKPVEAVRASVVHVLFNIIGVLIWLPFIKQLAAFAIVVSPGDVALAIPRQIANANTLFNIINTFLFIGFTAWFAKLAEKLVPDRADKTGVIIEPKFLDEDVLSIPDVALEQVRMEFGHMGEIAYKMLADLPEASRTNDLKKLEAIKKLDDKVDILETAIFNYLAKIRQQLLTEDQSKVHQDLMTVTVSLETLTDTIKTELSFLIKKFISKERVISKTTISIFNELHSQVLETLDMAVKSICENDQQAAAEVIIRKDRLKELSDQLLTRKSQQMVQEDSIQIETAKIEISLADKLIQIYSQAKRIARIVLPAEVVKPV